MVTADVFRKMTLSFEDTDEHPHFNRQAFRVRKKIFATLLVADWIAMVILSPAEQSVYCEFDSASFSPVQGAWGKKGCTYVDLKKVKTGILKEAIKTAYLGISAKYPPKKNRNLKQA